MSSSPIIEAADTVAFVAARQRARETFKFLWRELSWEYRRIVPALDMSAVQVTFACKNLLPGAPTVEHLWINDIGFDGDTVTGTLINQPEWVSSVAEGDAVCVPLEDITDWIYACAGQAYGAHTVNVLRANMSETQRREHDAAWGVDFGDPGELRVSPYHGANERPIPEHPMSLNVAERIEEALRADPTLITSSDASGHSMLHREALAGNLTPVRMLIKAGADPRVLDSKGRLPVDLARKMGWDDVVELLSH